jgi:UDP-2-acetamido-2-deoxy-ribo-hexuluronate aminotransferase
MRAIEMVDLKAQYEKMGGEIDNAIKKVLLSTKFIKGPQVAKFEDELKEYLGVNHVVSCGNGTDALQIALMALGLKEADEVITTNFTFIATVEVVALLGLKPVFVDVDPLNYNISIDAVRKAITPRTKAIIPVHLFGQCAPMEDLLEIAEEHNLFLIEDAAQAMGTDYLFADGSVKKAGTISHIGTTSFFPSKNLSCCGDGGAMLTNDESLASEMRCIANHGSTVKYYNDKIGVNSRLDTLQAAILSVKLKYLEEHNRARQEVADFYDNVFREIKGVIIPKREKYSTHTFHQYTIRVKDGERDSLHKYLKDAAIPSMVYYPVTIHSQKAYSYLGYHETDFPVSSALCKEVLSLPIHPEMDEEQLEYIAATLLKYFL